MSIQPVQPSSLPTSDFSPPSEPVQPSSGESRGTQVGSDQSGGANSDAPGRENSSARPARQRRGGEGQAPGRGQSGPRNTERAPEVDYSPGTDRSEGGKDTQDLDREERRKVRELRRTDRKVRAHEQAHLAAGGQYVKGGPNYEYKKGPDGKRYAVGGEVKLDTSKEDSPRETLQKMRQVKSAALAPGNPSSKDQQMAQSAAQKMANARMKLNRERTGEETDDNQKIGESQDAGAAEQPGQIGENSEADGSKQSPDRAPQAISGYTSDQPEFQEQPSGQVLNLLV